MKKLSFIIAFTGLLLCGVEAFKISEKEHENIDQMLEFGVKVFLNFLDRVKEVTEKMVREDMLRKSRIALQEHWDSFKYTANEIKEQEKGKGVQDDLVVAARTVHRLVMYYKDDISNMVKQVAVKEHYLPVVSVFNGIIEKAKAIEIMGNVLSNYLPEGAPIEKNASDLFCYLRFSNVETFNANILKVSMDVISRFKSIDFEDVYKRIASIFLEIYKKVDEIKDLEREKEKDDLIVSVSVAARVLVFYWDRLLELTDTPQLEEKFEKISKRLIDQDPPILATLNEMLEPVIDRENLNALWELHTDFFREYYMLGLSAAQSLISVTGPKRWWRTARVIGMGATVLSFPIYEQLNETGVFSDMKRLYFRAVNVTVALAGEEELNNFREVAFKNLKSLGKEVNRIANEERHNVPFPQVRAIARLLYENLELYADNINYYMDDKEADSLSQRLNNFNNVCINNLVARGRLIEEQLIEASGNLVDALHKFEHTFHDRTTEIDKARIEKTLKAGFKAVIFGLYSIYTSLHPVVDFILV